MLTEKQLEEAVGRITHRLDVVNTAYISKIAAQVKKIGELNQSSINRMVIMSEMGTDVTEITLQLKKATGLNLRDLFRIYNVALNDVYTDQRFRAYLNENPLPVEDKARLTHYAQAVSVQTAQNITNLSNTTVIAAPYREAVDRAIFAVSTGMADYKSATRDVIRSLGQAGMQVYYPSGYHRRLDTAVRQNIIDGANQIAQNASIMMGEMLDYDAIELSAHLMSAPDHEPVQGRVFLKSEFEKMQSGQSFVDIDGRHYEAFARPIGEWNCRHIAMGFSTEYSVRKYTDRQLQEWREKNAAGCEINGKHMSIYEAGQYMRQIETDIRREKDTAVAAQKADDDVLRQQCQKRINALSARYSQVAAASGITQRRDRMMVDGFRAVKVKK